MNKLHAFYERHKLRLWVGLVILAALILAAPAAVMSGDVVMNTQTLIIGFYRLAVLMLWAWVAGWLNDLANGGHYLDDKKLISEGNMAVAVTRTGGFAALFIGGALLLARV